jgi:hypothetical protein
VQALPTSAGTSPVWSASRRSGPLRATSPRVRRRSAWMAKWWRCRHRTCAAAAVPGRQAAVVGALAANAQGADMCHPDFGSFAAPVNGDVPAGFRRSSCLTVRLRRGATAAPAAHRCVFGTAAATAVRVSPLCPAAANRTTMCNVGHAHWRDRGASGHGDAVKLAGASVLCRSCSWCGHTCACSVGFACLTSPLPQRVTVHSVRAGF